MKVYGVAIRIHPLFLVVIAMAAYGHALLDVLVLFSIVLLHELGHVIAAGVLGYQTESIELLPFGGVARLRSGSLGFSPRNETVIALCGPLVNLLLALVALALHMVGLLSENTAMQFTTTNMALLFFNLLPGLPLDGGRIARAGLARTKGYYESTKAVTRMSFYLSAALMTVGFVSLFIGYADAGLFLLGVFLLVSAYTARKQNRYDLLRFLDAKRREKTGPAQTLSSLVVLGDTSIGEVAARLAPGMYHLIYVRETQGRLSTALGVVEEVDLLDAIFTGSMWVEPVRTLLSR